MDILIKIENKESVDLFPFENIISLSYDKVAETTDIYMKDGLTNTVYGDLVKQILQAVRFNQVQTITARGTDA